MKGQTIKNNKGFTLVETLFAVLILTFTIAGLMTIVANSLFSARYAKDEITVNYLLQEIVDYVRNDRDTTVFFGKDGGTWDSFYQRYENAKCSDVNGCYFDLSDLSSATMKIESCPNGVCPLLYYNTNATSGPFYKYDPTNLDDTDNIITNFRRQIIIKKNELNEDEIIVKVNVTWKNGSAPQTRSLSTSLTNW